MTNKRNFLWGGGISAAQCEGAWDEDGKSPVAVDFGNVVEGRSIRRLSYMKENGEIGYLPMFGNVEKGQKFSGVPKGNPEVFQLNPCHRDQWQLPWRLALGQPPPGR